MLHNIKALACFLICVSLLGCQSLSVEKTTVNHPVKVVTPRLSDARSLLLVQNIHVQYNDQNDNLHKEVHFEAYLLSNSRELKLSILFLGQRAWDISYNGETVFEERFVPIPQQLQASYLIRDLTFCYWSSKSIQSQTKDLLVLDQKGQRKILDSSSQETLLTIHYENGASPQHPVGHIVLVNHKENYQLTIDSVEA